MVDKCVLQIHCDDTNDLMEKLNHYVNKIILLGSLNSIFNKKYPFR